MRFMAEVAPERFGPIAQGYGVPFNPANPKPGALACADRTAGFIAKFDVPRRLRDAGVPRTEIGDIAAPIVHELERSKVLDRPVTQDEIRALLESAY
jgi:alcohol dehydrogenase class IV